MQLALTRDEKLASVRQAPYIEFYQELRKASLLVHDAGYAHDKLPSDRQLAAYEAALRLEVFATWETRVAAFAAYTSLTRWGDSGPFEYESEDELAFDNARASLLVAMRHDLRIEVDENRLSEADIIH